MKTKLIILLLIVSFILMPIGSILANEDPPGPDLFTFIFGGRIYYKKLGITIGISYKLPCEIDPSLKWHEYNPKEPQKLYPNTELRIDVVSENGRRHDDKLTTTIAFSDSKKQKMQVVHNFSGMYGTCTYKIPEYNTFNLFMRAYTEGGENKTQDNYAGWCFWVEPNKVASTTQNDSGQLRPETPNAQMQSEEIGNVRIQFFEKPPTVFSNVIIPKVVLFLNGKLFLEKHNVQGACNFSGVPSGEIKIKYLDQSNDWLVKKSSSEYQRDGRGYVWSVKKDQTVYISLERKPKGGESQ